ncbi:unnamed protein product [Durusdinium trenchii]|uniref:RRM domain-containing protein n=1 Tax=Durusdinium trenchii TaxID=1381693 RepID=A0ABP0KM03_9DINO
MSDLDKSATTLVVRSTCKLTYEGILMMLNKICEGTAYDYVYLPWHKLAVVNFTSPEACQAAHRTLTRLSTMDTSGVRYVKQAVVQGLAENLAIFLAKSGYDAIFDPGAPRVFVLGTSFPLSSAVNVYTSLLWTSSESKTIVVL